MGFRSFVGRGLLMSFFIIGGLSMVLYPHEYVDDLNLVASYCMNGKFGFVIDAKILLQHSQEVIVGTGAAVTLFGSLTVLGFKFAAFLMLISVLASSWLIYNPLRLETEAKKKALLVHLVYNIVITAGLLQTLAACNSCEKQYSVTTKGRSKN